MKTQNHERQDTTIYFSIVQMDFSTSSQKKNQGAQNHLQNLAFFCDFFG
jgi:hypothetical protein